MLNLLTLILNQVFDLKGRKRGSDFFIDSALEFP